MKKQCASLSVRRPVELGFEVGVRPVSLTDETGDQRKTQRTLTTLRRIIYELHSHIVLKHPTHFLLG